jgi:hypothetical protein
MISFSRQFKTVVEILTGVVICPAHREILHSKLHGPPFPHEKLKAVCSTFFEEAQMDMDLDLYCSNLMPSVLTIPAHLSCSARTKVWKSAISIGAGASPAFANTFSVSGAIIALLNSR